MHFNFSHLPVIDNHCHPFPLGRQTAPFARSWSISLYDLPARDLENTVLYQMVIQELRQVLKLPLNTPADEVVKARAACYRKDPKDYVQMLFHAAHIEKLLVDFGFPITAWYTGKYLSQEEIDEYYDMTEGVDTGYIFRIEVTYNQLFSKRLSFVDFQDLFLKNLAQEHHDHNAVALKTVIGYFTGLEVNPHVTESKAKKAYEQYLETPQDHAAEKMLRDYLLLRGVTYCRKNDLPLQIHTGWGDTPQCYLKKLNPLLLHDFFSSEKTGSVPLMMVHTGYPFVREAAYCVAHFPQVYLDVSSMVPYAARASETMLPAIMEMAPLTKILFGTDGGGIPDHMWLGAVIFKRVLARVMEDFVEEGIFTPDLAQKTAERILYDNAKNFYKHLA